MQATAKDLRFHTKELLETVSRGEEVLITYRGKPHAKLVPVSSGNDQNSGNPLRGIWKNHKESKNVNAYIKKLRRGRTNAR